MQAGQDSEGNVDGMYSLDFGVAACTQRPFSSCTLKYFKFVLPKALQKVAKMPETTREFRF
jgi:hypothetical protein